MFKIDKIFDKLKTVIRSTVRFPREERTLNPGSFSSSLRSWEIKSWAPCLFNHLQYRLRVPSSHCTKMSSKIKVLPYKVTSRKHETSLGGAHREDSIIRFTGQDIAGNYFGVFFEEGFNSCPLLWPLYPVPVSDEIRSS